MPSIPKPKHDHHLLKFPEGFLWGAATSAHQVEGDNFYNDWWGWEQKKPPHLRSGKGADQYHLYEDDFKLAKELGHNSHRLSIEWSRIEPEEGVFDLDAIEHYKQELKTLKDLGFTVMLTLHHYTNPIWLSRKGGWENFKAPYYFARFVQKIVPELKDFVDFWITINEPGIYVFMGYLGGDQVGSWPPDKKSDWLALKVTYNMIRAHKKAYRIIHSQVVGAKVGIANNVSSFEPTHRHSIMEQLTVIINDFFANHSFYFLTKGYHDFIGLNYYFNWRFNLQKGKLFPSIVNIKEEHLDVTDMGWEIYPEGIFDVLNDLSDGLPIYITECGIASTNDDRRNRFLIHYLQEVYRAIQSGVKVKGFFYWSLIDTFEWHWGYNPRFGLIEVNYESEQRIPRPSSLVYKDVILNNGIPHKLLRFLGHTVQAMEVLEQEAKELRLTKDDFNLLEKAAKQEQAID